MDLGLGGSTAKSFTAEGGKSSRWSELRSVTILTGLVLIPREEQDDIIFNAVEQSSLLPSNYAAPQPATTVESPPHSPDVPEASPQPETTSKRSSRSLRSRHIPVSPAKPTSTTNTPHLPRSLTPSPPPPIFIPTASIPVATVEDPTTSLHEDILRDDASWEGAPHVMHDDALARGDFQPEMLKELELDPLAGKPVDDKAVPCIKCDQVVGVGKGGLGTWRQHCRIIHDRGR